MKRSAASTPRTDPSGPTSSAMRWLVSPKPQPMSSARSPGRGGGGARARSPGAPRPCTRARRVERQGLLALRAEAVDEDVAVLDEAIEQQPVPGLDRLGVGGADPGGR